MPDDAIPPAPGIIAIEGPIGVGKTTLARRVADAYNTDLMLEGAADNPFLEKYYADPARYALPTQVHFLFQRVEQLQSFRQNDLFRAVYISDYMLEKDRLFARMTLSADEFRIYEQLYERVVDTVPVPDLVIYLHAPVPTLLERIRRRGLDYEQRIEAAYLHELCAAYVAFFRHYTDAPVLFVDTDGANFAEGEQPFAQLLEAIRSGIRGKHHFELDPITAV